MKFSILNREANDVWSVNNVSNAVKRFERKATLDKIAFLVMNNRTLKNWQSFLKLIPHNKFDILYPYKYDTPYMKSEHENILSVCKSMKYNARNLLDVLKAEEGYKLAVSANLWFNDYGRIDTLISKKHLRILYSLGASNEMLSLKKNSIYDEIYCYGNFQRNNIQTLPATKIFTVGNPRFDFLFDGSITKDQLKQTLQINNNKKVLAWFPTMSGFCSSTDVWGDQIAMLADEYDVFTCPHMFTSQEELEKLSRSKVRILSSNLSAELMFVADYCMCDYGGAAFSSIYLDKNLILLNVGGVDECGIYGDSSPEFLLRKKMKSYNPEDIKELQADLNNEDVWLQQKSVRAELFEEFFADFRGTSGLYIYKLLRDSFSSLC